MNEKLVDTGHPVAWIIGGSSGLGLHLAKEIAGRGYRVVLFGRDSGKLEEARFAVTELVPDERCDVCSLDVLNSAEVDTKLSMQFDKDRRLDLLVNCVGKSCRVAIDQATAEMYDQWMQVNFQSAVNVTMTSLDWLIQSKGSIVNIGSLASRVPWRWIAPYAASKRALASFTDSLRIELEGKVHVLLVCPGPITRDDAGERYRESTDGLDQQANQPGAGAPVRTLDPAVLSKRIVDAVKNQKSELIVPAKTRILMLAYACSVRLGDWLLRRLVKN